MSEDHRTIWLEPNCEDLGKDRQWCQDDVWGQCDECGKPSVKYIRADLAVTPAQGATTSDALDLATQLISLAEEFEQAAAVQTIHRAGRRLSVGSAPKIAEALRFRASAALGCSSPAVLSKPGVCCRCDAPLSCASCGVEQPDDSEHYAAIERERDQLRAQVEKLTASLDLTEKGIIAEYHSGRLNGDNRIREAFKNLRAAMSHTSTVLGPAVLSEPQTVSEQTPAPELSERWPLGCHSPSSCSRNGRCMYVGCKHDGKDISAIASAFTRPDRETHTSTDGQANG